MANEWIIYIIAAFVGGFLVAWAIRTLAFAKLKKEYKSVQGYLESERLKKETLQKENRSVHQQKINTETLLSDRLKEAHNMLMRMDEDILLLQKNNEETEAMLEQQSPELHKLKLRLLEAQNEIARYKSKLGEK